MPRIALLIALFYLFACQAEVSPPPLPENPRRIITFTPSLTETVFALGAGDRVVGTTDWCNHPPEARTRERLGGLADPDYEGMVALQPDLFVISAASSLQKIADDVEKLKIPVLRVPNDSLEDIYLAVDLLGETLGLEEKARQFHAGMKAEFAGLAEKLSAVKRPRVLLVLERRAGTVLDITAVGGKNVIDTMVGLAGGENIFADSPLAFPKVTKEEILHRAPDIILDFSVHALSEDGDDARALQSWSVLSTLPAVKKERVIIVPRGFDLYPGPRMAEHVARFAEFFHPQLFPAGK